MKDIIGISHSSQGYSHIKSHKECQDASMFIDGKDYAAIMVSDGHGGDKHFRSATGSQIAKEICIRALQDYAHISGKSSDAKQVERMLRDFGKHLIYSWREEVENELIIHPITENELSAFSKETAFEIERHPHIAFGATLILVILAGSFVQIMQIGDGDCRVKTEKGIEKPLKDDESLRFGRTASLCNENASERIRNVILPSNTVEACFISTDGVLNSFDSDENFCRFANTLIEELAASRAEAVAELEDFLPKLTERGSGDDVSVAIMMKSRQRGSLFP